MVDTKKEETLEEIQAKQAASVEKQMINEGYSPAVAEAHAYPDLNNTRKAETELPSELKPNIFERMATSIKSGVQYFSNITPGKKEQSAQKGRESIDSNRSSETTRNSLDELNKASTTHRIVNDKGDFIGTIGPEKLNPIQKKARALKHSMQRQAAKVTQPIQRELHALGRAAKRAVSGKRAGRQ